MGLEQAYAACEAMARAHYENFPVASRLLPRAMRPHVAAVYAFARVADDLADEDGLEPTERLAALLHWEAWLRAAVGAATPPPGGTPPAVRGVDPNQAALVFEAVGHTIRDRDLPVQLFHDLLSAFRQDVSTRRYDTWDDVLDYCRRSANPVGRLVLRIAGYRSDDMDRSSDALCTALQLTNFWQDLAIDWRRGRLYLPLSERDAAGADERDLDAGRMTPAWARAMAQATAVTRELFARGAAVCDLAGGRLRYELRATWVAAHRVLDRVERAGFDVFNARPALGGSDVLPIVLGTLAWRRGVARPLAHREARAGR